MLRRKNNVAERKNVTLYVAESGKYGETVGNKLPNLSLPVLPPIPTPAPMVPDFYRV